MSPVSLTIKLRKYHNKALLLYTIVDTICYVSCCWGRPRLTSSWLQCRWLYKMRKHHYQSGTYIHYRVIHLVFFIFELNKEYSFQILGFLDILQELSMYSNSCQIKKKIPTVIKLNGSPDMFQRHIQMTKFKCIPPP